MTWLAVGRRLWRLSRVGQSSAPSPPSCCVRAIHYLVLRPLAMEASHCAMPVRPRHGKQIHGPIPGYGRTAGCRARWPNSADIDRTSVELKLVQQFGVARSNSGPSTPPAARCAPEQLVRFGAFGLKWRRATPGSGDPWRVARLRRGANRAACPAAVCGVRRSGGGAASCAPWHGGSLVVVVAPV